MEQEKRKIAYLVIGKGMNRLRQYLTEKDSYIIGIDKGAYLLASEGLFFDEAVGDFDSVDEKEYQDIEKYAGKITKLNPMKDESDTAHAYERYKDKGDRIILLGAIQGKRIEHFIANMFLLLKDEKVCFVDENSNIYSLSARKTPYLFKRKDAYYSFFPIEEAILTLEGFQYPLKEKVLAKGDALGLSNELAAKEGSLLLEKGKLLVIETKKEANS